MLLENALITFFITLKVCIIHRGRLHNKILFIYTVIILPPKIQPNNLHNA